MPNFIITSHVEGRPRNATQKRHVIEDVSDEAAAVAAFMEQHCPPILKNEPWVHEIVESPMGSAFDLSPGSIPFGGL